MSKEKEHQDAVDQEELEDQNGELLPEREAMSLINPIPGGDMPIDPPLDPPPIEAPE